MPHISSVWRVCGSGQAVPAAPCPLDPFLLQHALLGELAQRVVSGTTSTSLLPLGVDPARGHALALEQIEEELVCRLAEAAAFDGLLLGRLSLRDLLALLLSSRGLRPATSASSPGFSRYAVLLKCLVDRRDGVQVLLSLPPKLRDEVGQCLRCCRFCHGHTLLDVIVGLPQIVDVAPESTEDFLAPPEAGDEKNRVDDEPKIQKHCTFRTKGLTLLRLSCGALRRDPSDTNIVANCNAVTKSGAAARQVDAGIASPHSGHLPSLARRS